MTLIRSGGKRVILDVTTLPTIGESKYIYHNTTDGYFYNWNDNTNKFDKLSNTLPIFSDSIANVSAGGEEDGQFLYITDTGDEFGQIQEVYTWIGGTWTPYPQPNLGAPVTVDTNPPSGTAIEGAIHLVTDDGTPTGTVLEQYIYDADSGVWIEMQRNAQDTLKFGTASPTSNGEWDGEEYFVTSNGQSTGTVLEQWIWDKQSGTWIQRPTPVAQLTTTSLTPVYYTTSWVNADNTTNSKVAKLMKLSDGSLVDDVDVTWTGHGLDIGEIYYLDSVSGGYTKTPPSSPNYTQQLFIVKDANTIHIDIEQAYVASATDSVTFGTTDPTSPSTTANEGDIYFKTSDGTANGTVISTFIYDKTSNKWVAASASSEITTTSLAPKTGNGTAYVNPTLVSETTLVDEIQLSDGSYIRSGQVTFTGHGLPIHTYFYASATAPYYTATVPTTGWSQQLFYTQDANTIDVLIQEGTLLDGSSSSQYMVTAFSNANDSLPGSFTVQTNKYNSIDTANCIGGAESAFNTTTYRFTPTRAGWYSVTALYDVFRGSTTQAGVILRKNGSNIAVVNGFGNAWVQVSKIVYMNGTTDYLDAANQGSAAATRQQSNNNNFFQAKWLHY